jgi:hypothetical protein
MRFHYRAVPIVLAAVLIEAFAEHGETGGGFLLAAPPVFSALLIVLLAVIPRLKPAAESR